MNYVIEAGPGRLATQFCHITFGESYGLCGSKLYSYAYHIYDLDKILDGIILCKKCVIECERTLRSKIERAENDIARINQLRSSS